MTIAITTSRANASPIHDWSVKKRRARKSDITKRKGIRRMRTGSNCHRLNHRRGPRTGFECDSTKRHPCAREMNVSVSAARETAATERHHVLIGRNDPSGRFMSV